MNNIMIDLETMGKGPDAAIIAIGAVAFDETGLGPTFYRAVDLESSMAHGGKMDPSTVMWWMQQSQAARDAFRPEANAATVVQALSGLDLFIVSVAGRGAQVWGNGATFDNVILKTAYERAGMSVPWEFWNDRCYRTLKNLYPQVPFVKPTVAHNALEDAKAQALHASKILAFIKENSHAQVV